MGFRPEVLVSGEWCGNALVFATEAESHSYARDLMVRWTLVRDTRSVACQDAVTHEWSDDEGLGPVGGPKRWPARRVQL